MGERIGIAGTGRMGTAFAERLVATGHTVTVWNRTASGTKRAQSSGASVADNLSALVAVSDVILISVRDAAAVAAVIDGLAASDLSGRLVIDTSTLLPPEKERAAARVSDADGAFVDCSVGGTVAPALKGALLGLAGGSDADVARARTVMDHLCKRVAHVGPVGAGAQMKLAVNLPLALYWAALGESLSMLRGAGLSGEVIVDLLASSSAGPTVLGNRAGVVAATIDGTDQPGTFDIDGLAKDLQLARDWAAAKGAQVPLADAAARVYDAAQAEGLGGFDGSSLSRFAARR
ncbi:3-hydroxyisobutyrate dehydrogenase [Palleronia pelagia]|uniref:3-hydroxyisobutyrate dehydrogenase n=2 Tax=Palleronia pelagia TaxID=387096 RepID=A0A1H8AHH2_9RHOB|nr:3-hydroxyisobutyrate dehydrogenase [Palleronia pelagia]